MSTMLKNLLFTTKHHESVSNQELTEIARCSWQLMVQYDNLYLSLSNFCDGQLFC